MMQGSSTDIQTAVYLMMSKLNSAIILLHLYLHIDIANKIVRKALSGSVFILEIFKLIININIIDIYISCGNMSAY